MSKAKTQYRVSIRQIDEDGHVTWHGVLTTEDPDKAKGIIPLRYVPTIACKGPAVAARRQA